MSSNPSGRCVPLKTFTRNELEELVRGQNHRCVSLYLPTTSAGRESLENPVRLKKLLKQAKTQLEESGLRENAAAAVLQPARQLLNEYPFWQLQDRGLALFLSSGFFEGYQLPYAVRERAVVAPGFHFKALFPLLADNQHFFVLAVSRKAVKLFRATRYRIRQIPLDDIITSQAEALRYDDPEQCLQVHTSNPGSTGTVHGQGGAREDTKERTLRYFQMMSEGLQKHLRNETAPLLLAAVDYYLPILKQANVYPHLVDDVLAGNPDDTAEEALRDRGWELLQPILNKPRQRASEAVIAGIVGRTAIDDVAASVTAACHGRAEKCFVALDREIWGRFDRKSCAVKPMDAETFEARDLLDLAGVETVLQGGDVYPMPDEESVPGSGPLSVLLRY